MVNLEQGLAKLYRSMLGLYPARFREEFAAEMQAVFGEALAAARCSGFWSLLRLCGRELRDLPTALLREHWSSDGEKETHMRENRLSMNNPAEKTPDAGWGKIALAVLPFVLYLLIDIIPKLVVEAGLLTWEADSMRLLTTTLGILALEALLVVLIVAWRQKWPLWSASWFMIFVLVPTLLFLWLVSLLIKEGRLSQIFDQGLPAYFVVPVAVAVLLYAVTRLDRRRGMLAALPLLYFLWSPNMEFVADPLEVAIKIASTALIYLAIALLMKQREWRVGFYAVLIVNLVVGFLFSYAGTYHGGTLPFTAPGASLVEVIRSLIPQYLATSAILLGPFFAWKIRRDGRSAGRSGIAGYRLALFGLLLVILVNIASLMMGTDDSLAANSLAARNVLTVVIVLGLVIYILGLFVLYRGAQFVQGVRAWAERLLLVLLPLALPLALCMPFIEWTRPVSNLYGFPQLWQLPRVWVLSLGLLWLVLSVWLLTRESGSSSSPISIGEASEAPLPT
jgi:uncharacterized Tic20 family protein